MILRNCLYHFRTKYTTFNLLTISKPLNACFRKEKRIFIPSTSRTFARKIYVQSVISNKKADTTQLENNKNDSLLKESKKSELARLFTLAKSEKAYISGAIGMLVISSSVTLAVPYCMGMLIDLVQAANNTGNIQDTLQPIAYGLASIFLIGGLANAARVYLLQMSGQRITKRLRETVFKSVLAQEVAFFDKTRTGELINRLSSDVELVSGSVTQNISDGLRSLAQITAGIGMMFFMSPELAMVTVTVVPTVAIAAVIYGRYVRDITKRTQTALAEATQLAEEKLSNVRTVRSFAREQTEEMNYASKTSKVLQLAQTESVARSIFFGLMGLAGNCVMLMVMYKGGLMVHASQLSVGDLSAFLLYSGYVGVAISGLSGFYSTVNKSLGASTRLWELVDRVPSIPLTDGIIPVKEASISDITFTEVNFSYPTRDEALIFNKLNLNIEAGKVTAIVGPSGCGKSTLGALLLRFYQPNSGTITVGGKNINYINPQWIRNNIGTVAQEPILFSDTIRANLMYGAPQEYKATEEQLYHAAKQANALQFIKKLPSGFDTHVGERGLTLSGGQRQRVAIARALLKDPPILLLDEATSALDAESEHLVREALARVSIGRTTIIIAHRLSTVRGADLIVVLGGQGAVQEKGSYDDLMQLENGAFRQLINKQTLVS